MTRQACPWITLAPSPESLLDPLLKLGDHRLQLVVLLGICNSLICSQFLDEGDQMPIPSAPSIPAPFVSFDQLQLQSRLEVLRDALRKANVSDATANQVVQQQEQMEAYEGYVFSVSTTQVTNITYVHLGGRTVINPSHGSYIFSFPPNDQKYLQELVRAMNHPHFRVFLTAKDINTDPIIIQVTVVLDYNLTPIPNYTPPFDAVEIKTG